MRMSVMIVIMGVVMIVDVAMRGCAIIPVLVHFLTILRVCPGRRSPPADVSGQFDTSPL
jgi:hypothetical protein